MKRILRCTACGRYTMKEECPGCGQPAVTPRPAKYSGEDRYGDLRRQAKRDALAGRGLL